MTASAIPASEGTRLRPAVRRTTILRIALALGLLAALALAFVAARGYDVRHAPLVPSGSTGMVVLDMSASVYEGAMEETLQKMATTGEKAGLVVFSDTAYEALPPSTPAEGLKGWLSLFRRDTPWEYPWATSFAGGTVISTGLVLARTLLRRDHVAHPHVVLVSDLADSDQDLQRLETVVAQYQREHIDLRVIKVSPGTEPATRAASTLPNAAFVADAASEIVDPTHRGDSGVLPVVLALLVCLVGALAAANELSLHPLTWRRA
jgi:hypothetical protein